MTPIAAATATGSDELVEACGVLVSPEPSAPLSEASLSANERWPPICELTSPPDPPPLLLLLSLVPGVPFADAVPLLVLADEPSAWKPTDPVAVTSRDVPDETWCCEIVSPSATPTAASLPSASPAAVEDADAVMCACASSLPVSVSAAPVPRDADTETSEMVIATAGVTPTVPPFAPVFASVVAASVSVAVIVRS